MWEHYEKIKRIGLGGMGEVWLVQNKKTRLPYAAKMLRPDKTRPKDETRFRREVEILMDMDHPNIAKIYDATTDDERPLGYLTEYCPAGDILHQKDLDIDLTIRDLVKAVAHLHEHGFIHRDIKPGNVLVALDGRIRLVDFGLAAPVEAEVTDSTVTNMVSRGFAPPEQHENMAAVDQGGDIYAVGAVWYYLLQGRLFIFSHDVEKQYNAIDRSIRWVLKRCLAYNRRDRFSSAECLESAVLDALDSPVLGEYFSLEVGGRARFIEERLGFREEQKVQPAAAQVYRDLLQELRQTERMRLYETDQELAIRLATLHEAIFALMNHWSSIG